MSLFKTRSFWTTQCEDVEHFDQNSMITTSLNGGSDYVITGSQSGVLRIFKPSCEIVDDELNGCLPTDLVVEKVFEQPILQIGSGRLVTGSLVYQTAVLNPRHLSVHLLKIKENSVEHSTQNTLELIYDHHLQRSAANFTIGQFGGSQNRDFICVQFLDGAFTFFEQENLTFSCFLSDFLLPSPLSYLKKTDSFITANGNWAIVSYKYNTLSEAGDEGGKPNSKKVIPVWTYNLGESVIDISVVEDDVNKLNYIMILGEKNLYCLFDSGRLNFMKKLEYSPVCFETYVLSEKIYTLIVSETSNLLVYETTTLKWCAKLQFLPIAIRRAFLKNVNGALVFLSEDGRLECSYLGTEPNLFVSPPMIENELDLEKIEDELNNLNKTIKETYGNELKFSNQNADKEIDIKITVDKNLEPCAFKTNLKNLPIRTCTVNVEITPQISFDEVQLTLSVSKPLTVEPSTRFFINQDEPMAVKCRVYLFDDGNVPSLFLSVVVSVISSLGVPKSFNKFAMLPLSLVVEACPAQKEGDHKVTLNINQNAVPLLSLFPEFADDTKSTSSIAFRSISTDAAPVTILLAKSSDRYRIQTSSFTSLSLVIEQLIHRLAKHYLNIDEFKMVFNSSLPSNEVVAYVKRHFDKRRNVVELEDFLDRLSAQFRTIQKRLISKFKVKNPTPLTNLEILIEDTYKEISKTVSKLLEANRELMKAQTELTCALNLIGNLIKIMNIDDKLKEILSSVFCPSVEDLDSQNWEDVMDSTLCYLLRTYLAKSEKDKLRISQTGVEKVTDISKMEKHLVQVMERISKTENTSSDQIEDGIAEEATNPESEKEEEKPLGNQFGAASMRILSARRSLSRRRHKNDEKEE